MTLTGQCLAWRTTRVGEHVFHNHGGSVHGFNTSVGFHRPSRLGVVVLLNLWPTTAAAELALDMLEAAVGGLAVRSWPRPDPGPAGRPPDGLLPFLGGYRAEPGIRSDLVWRDGALRFETAAGQYGLHTPAVLSPIVGRDGAFRFQTGRGAGEEIAFEMAAGGGPASFAIGGFIYRRTR